MRPDKLLAALAMLALAPAAQALPPFITDDTGTQGDGRWQLELIGLANRVEEDGTLQERSSGLSDVVLEAKWRFYERGGTSRALKPSLSLPTGDEGRGLGTGKSSYGMNLILTHEAGPWVLMANAAFTRLRYRREEDEQGNHSHLRRYSAGATYQAAERWRLAAELGYRTNATRDDPFLPGRHGSYGMLGAIWSFSKDDDLALGVRRAASGGDADWAFIAGATFRW